MQSLQSSQKNNLILALKVHRIQQHNLFFPHSGSRILNTISSDLSSSTRGSIRTAMWPLSTQRSCGNSGHIYSSTLSPNWDWIHRLPAFWVSQILVGSGLDTHEQNIPISEVPFHWVWNRTICWCDFTEATLLGVCLQSEACYNKPDCWHTRLSRVALVENMLQSSVLEES